MNCYDLKRQAYEFFIVLLLYFVLNSSTAFAALYSNCIRSDATVFASNIGNLQINGVPQDCRENCDKDCKVFSWKDRSGIEHNQGLIWRCITACQFGDSFTANPILSKVVTEDPLVESFWYSSEALTVQSASCQGNQTRTTETAIHKAPLTIVNNDTKKELWIKIGPKPGDEQKIYVRGRKEISMNPIIPNVAPTLGIISLGNTNIGTDNYFEDGKPQSDAISKRQADMFDDSSPSKEWSVKEENNIPLKSTHACFAGLGIDIWDVLMSNKILWECRLDPKCMLDFITLTPDQIRAQNKKAMLEKLKRALRINDSAQNIPDCYSQWAISDRTFTNTGILIGNKDKLRIFWSSHIILGDGQTLPYLDYKLAKLSLMQGSLKNLLSEADRKNINEAWNKFGYNPDTAPFEIMRDLSTLEINGLKNLVGEDGRDIDYDLKICGAINKSYLNDGKWYGLTGAIVPGISRNKAHAKIGSFPVQCADVADPGFAKYQYSGSLDGLPTDDLIPLKIRHYINDRLNGLVGKNKSKIIGGTQVRINWDSTTLEDGIGLQYAIGFTTNGNLKIGSWRDCTITGYSNSWEILINESSIKQSISQIGEENAEGIYELFLRINPNSIGFKDANSTAFQVYKQIGTYSLVVEGSPESVRIQDDRTKILKEIIRTTREQLLGKRELNEPVEKDSLVGKIYTKFANSVSSIVSGILVLHLMLVGMIYTFGSTRDVKSDFIIRTLKVAFVATICSKKGWEFLGDYVVPLFTDGILATAAAITPKIVSEVATAIDVRNLNDALSVLDGLDAPIQYILNGITFRRLGALFTVGIAGPVMALILIFVILTAFFNIIQVAMIYLFAMLTVVWLVLLAPVMLPLLLFQFSKDLFDKWIQTLISASLYPILLLPAMSIFGMLLTFTLQSAFYFTICPTCVIHLSGVATALGYAFDQWKDSCLISGWTPIAMLHIPPGSNVSLFYTPVNLLASALILLLISSASSKFIVLVSKIANRISKFFQQGRPDQSIVGMSNSVLQQGANATKHLFNGYVHMPADFIVGSLEKVAGNAGWYRTAKLLQGMNWTLGKAANGGNYLLDLSMEDRRTTRS